MLAYVIRRLWQMIPTMLGVVLLIFILFNWVGGDPAYILAGKMSNPEQIENIRKQLGVDQPYYVQLWIFIKQILTFDYGASWSTGESVSQIILTRLGPSHTFNSTHHFTNSYFNYFSIGCSGGTWLSN